MVEVELTTTNRTTNLASVVPTTFPVIVDIVIAVAVIVVVAVVVLFLFLFFPSIYL